MSAPTFARRHRGSIAATAVVAAAASVLVAYAISSDGYAARHVDLNDGGIWVTSNADGLYGRLNKPIGQLDAGFFPPGGAQAAYTVDVVQDGSAVLAFDKGAGKVFPVDVRSGAPLATQAAVVPGNDELRLAGSTAAVLDPSSGRLWAAQVTGDDLSGLAKLDTGEKPLVTVGAGADLAVSSDGTIFAASASKQQLVTIRPANGRFARPAITELHHQMESLAITSVGDTPVVVDATGGVALLPGGRTVPVPKDATDAVLQQPGPKAPAVYLATSSSTPVRARRPVPSSSAAACTRRGAARPACTPARATASPPRARSCRPRRRSASRCSASTAGRSCSTTSRAAACGWSTTRSARSTTGRRSGRPSPSRTARSRRTRATRSSRPRRTARPSPRTTRSALDWAAPRSCTYSTTTPTPTATSWRSRRSARSTARARPCRFPPTDRPPRSRCRRPSRPTCTSNTRSATARAGPARPT